MPTERSVVASLLSGDTFADSLMVSSQRFQVQSGHVFSQPSLSDYFRGVRRVSAGRGVPEAEQDANLLHLPVRIFNPSSLVTTRGRSVIERILARSDYLLIEDADLRPSDLLAHLRAFNVASELRVEDLASLMRLTGNYAYLIGARARRPLALGGERIL